VPTPVAIAWEVPVQLGVKVEKGDCDPVLQPLPPVRAKVIVREPPLVLHEALLLIVM
jgi:hypothetical protein